MTYRKRVAQANLRHSPYIFDVFVDDGLGPLIWPDLDPIVFVANNLLRGHDRPYPIWRQNNVAEGGPGRVYGIPGPPEFWTR